MVVDNDDSTISSGIISRYVDFADVKERKHEKRRMSKKCRGSIV